MPCHHKFMECGAPCDAVALFRSGHIAVTGSRDGCVTLWCVKGGQRLRRLQAHTAQVFAVAVCGDDSRIASGSKDTTVRVWDAQSGELVATLDAGHFTGVPVIDGVELVGIVSRRDIDAATRDDRLHLPVSSCMSKPVKTIEHSELLEDALARMVEADIIYTTQ